MSSNASHSLGYLLFGAMLSAAVSGCGGGGDDAAPPVDVPDATPPDAAPPDATPPDARTAPEILPIPISLALTVTGTDGSILAGAVVTTGQVNETADQDGRVLLQGLGSGELQYTVAAEGHAPFVNTVVLHEQATLSDEIKLLPVVTFERTAEEESSVEHESVSVRIPAGALVHENGDPVTGTFDIELVPYEPGELSWDRRPGHLIGITADGKTQYLKLYGAFSLTLRQGNKELDINPGQKITVEFALDATVCAVFGQQRSSVPLWSITEGEDEAWQPEGEANLQRAADGTCTLSFELAHLTWWAVADPYAATRCFDVTLVDSDGTRRPNLEVAAAGDVTAGTFTYDEAFTGGDGRACVNAEQGGTVRLFVGAEDDPLWAESRIASGVEASCQSDRGACEPVMITITQPSKCVPGSYRDCGYDGPTGTENVGECRAGRDYCDVTGTGFLGCRSSVVPQTEICETPAGEDCDGNSSCVTAAQVVAGFDHACARLDDGTVKCWGGNDYGQLGLGDMDNRGDGPLEMGDNLPAVDLGTGRTAQALAAGADYTCALLDDDTVKCWGDNEFGQLGLGDTGNRGQVPGDMGDNLPAVDLGTGRTARALAAGVEHTCALLDDDTVKCWGYNGTGQLGLGDTNNRGDGPLEMGDNLPAVDLGTGRTAQALAASTFHTCALLDDGTVKCWGRNDDGQLGLGDTNYRGDGPLEMGDNLPAVDLGTGRTAQALAAGEFHTCALLDDGTVKCWGWNYTGQLGLGDTSDRGDAPLEMGDDLPAVDLGTGRTAQALAAGYLHTCALLDDGTVKCWGRNNSGQLGLGDTGDRGQVIGEMGDSLPAVDLGTGRTAQALAAGEFHTCALLDDGTVKCWGRNGYGQLGLGDTSDRGDEPVEMGDALPAIYLGSAP
jgi:alpha-tubulin suppressor-like RCC1 family protein